MNESGDPCHSDQQGKPAPKLEEVRAEDHERVEGALRYQQDSQGGGGFAYIRSLIGSGKDLWTDESPQAFMKRMRD